MNGVDRGGGSNGYGRHDKCSYRDGAGRITRVLSSLGFRLCAWCSERWKSGSCVNVDTKL